MLSTEFEQRAREFPKGVLQLLHYADVYQPTTTFICDCDAHPIGKTLEMLCAQRGEPFPSADTQPLNYKKISRKVPKELLVTHLSDVFDRITQNAVETPRILVIDDYVSSGGTRYQFNQACRQYGLRADVRWITFAGRGADYSYLPHMTPAAIMPWRDRPDVLGISYDQNLKAIHPVTEESERFYSLLEEAVSSIDLKAPVA